MHPDYHNHPGHADHDPSLDSNFRPRVERALQLTDNPFMIGHLEAALDSDEPPPRDTPADLEAAFRRVAMPKT